jgi:hypothetical protein
MWHGIAIALLMAAGAAGAQGPAAGAGQTAVLRWTGEPLRLPFACSPDDLAMFETPCTAAEPCPVYLQLAAVRGVEDKVFLAGNLHNRATTMYSILLASEDGGTSWTEVHPRIRGAGLDQIYFHDARTGWVSGHILTVPPRDPFFLLTTDGGKHWRRRDIFGETRIGVIEEFSFDDARSGTVLIDRVRASETGARWERYETMTGGADWMIREVSASPIPMKVRRPVEPDPNWRLAEEATGGAWRIERRRGEEWTVVSTFEVEVGACAPPPLEVAEEEEQEEAAETEEPQLERPVEELPTAPGGVFQIPGPAGPKPAREGRPPARRRSPALP